jgi:predicted site-specific integrase-resolvase
MKETIDVDTTNWPNEASLANWTRILGVSHITMQRYRKEGRLPGKRKLDRSLLISKETILKAFGIK